MTLEEKAVKASGGEMEADEGVHRRGWGFGARAQIADGSREIQVGAK